MSNVRPKSTVVGCGYLKGMTVEKKRNVILRLE